MMAQFEKLKSSTKAKWVLMICLYWSFVEPKFNGGEIYEEL